MDVTKFAGDILRDYSLAEADTLQWVSGDWQEAECKAIPLWYEDTQLWHNEIPIKQAWKEPNEVFVFTMMDYLAGAVAITKLFQVHSWVAAYSFFWRDENNPGKIL